MTADIRLMNVRQFLRGGYRELGGPTTIIRGSEVLGTWTPAGHEASPVATIAPVPAVGRQARQAKVDEVLRKVNRAK